MGKAPAAGAKASGLALHYEVEQFLYRQAELLDRKRWQDYIDLFTDDGVYWMPADPAHEHWDGVPRYTPAREGREAGIEHEQCVP